MASRKLKAINYIVIDGIKHLWYEVDQDRNVIWHLPPDIKEKKQMLKNIGERMSRYCSANPQATILNV